MQLELFEREHVPLFRARAALEEGDLRRAHEALAEADAARTKPRLVLLDHLLPASPREAGPSPERVHAIFEDAFATRAEPTRSGVRAHDWFRLYVAHLAAALDATPERRFRGWCQLHYELAAGRPRAALASAERLVYAAASRSLAGWVWLEAARAAYASGLTEQARRWTLVACLASSESLSSQAPSLAPTGQCDLDAPERPLPPLPDAILDLWTEAVELGLPEPASSWVPSLGILNATFGVADLRAGEVARGAGFDLAHDAPPDEPAPRAFLRALVAAREARVREPGRCGALELRAREAMKRASPALFDRYMETLGLYG